MNENTYICMYVMHTVYVSGFSCMCMHVQDWSFTSFKVSNTIYHIA